MILTLIYATYATYAWYRDVLTARAGYEIAGHQLIGRRAIVATAHTKKPASVPQGEALPESIGGIPVDVREANLYQRLRAIDPLAAEVSQIYRRPEDAELERELPSWRIAEERAQRNPKETRSEN